MPYSLDSFAFESPPSQHYSPLGRITRISVLSQSVYRQHKDNVVGLLHRIRLIIHVIDYS